MKRVNVAVRILVLAVGTTAWVDVGCSDADAPPPDPGANGKERTALPGAIDTFGWEEPAPASDAKLNPKSVEISAKDSKQNESVFDCTTYDHESHGNYDKIVWLAEQSGPVKPGIVLQGRPFKTGQLQPLPIKRTTIKISINLAIPNPTRAIDAPDTASIQEAISKFQAEADALPDTPGNIEHTVEEVTKSEQVSLSLGLHASYSGVLASASLDTNLSHEMGLTQHTVVARLVQPMYTVSFADEAIPTAAEFFDPSLTDADWKAQEAAGTISADNPPVFISSVTYGRMILVSLSSTQGETRDTMKTLIEGSTVAYSASAEIEAKRAEQWSTLKHQEYQRGGSANNAAEAITSGDFRKFFAKAAPSTMVPIAFTVKTLNGTRKVARIGDLTKYNAPDCVTSASWQPATTLADGAFKSIGVGTADDVWAVNATQPNKLFKYDRTLTTPSKFVPVDVTFAPNHVSPINQISVGRDGTVGMRLADESGLLYRGGTFTYLNECTVHFDCNNGGRPFNWLEVFDANLMAVTNREDFSWTTDGFATAARFIDSSGTGIVGIDQFHKIWHASLNTGVQLIDGDNPGNWTSVGSLGKVDSLTVGAPNDVWITTNGTTYQFDQRWLNDKNVAPWISRNMGTQMPVIDVGIDGHLWGIGTDGRIHRLLGLRP
jgi:hypothetical protein